MKRAGKNGSTPKPANATSGKRRESRPADSVHCRLLEIRYAGLGDSNRTRDHEVEDPAWPRRTANFSGVPRSDDTAKVPPECFGIKIAPLWTFAAPVLRAPGRRTERKRTPPAKELVECRTVVVLGLFCAVCIGSQHFVDIEEADRRGEALWGSTRAASDPSREAGSGSPKPHANGHAASIRFA